MRIFRRLASARTCDTICASVVSLLYSGPIASSFRKRPTSLLHDVSPKATITVATRSRGPCRTRAADRVAVARDRQSSRQRSDLVAHIRALHRQEPAVVLVPLERVDLQLVQRSRRPVQKRHCSVIFFSKIGSPSISARSTSRPGSSAWKSPTSSARASRDDGRRFSADRSMSLAACAWLEIVDPNCSSRRMPCVRHSAESRSGSPGS